MRILVVEDEPKIAKALKRGFELQKYSVDLANNGEVALDLALSESYDLVILDSMLPKLPGLEVCRALRAAKNVVPVLMLTALGQTHDKVSGLDAGADDYLVKPFSFEELFARVRALLRRPQQQAQTKLHVGDLILEKETGKVSRANQEIRLSAKEFSILEYLLRQPGKICSKEEIITHVWSYEANTLPSTVEVHMKHLRDKIDLPFSFPLLHTARGFGYVIKDNRV